MFRKNLRQTISFLILVSFVIQTLVSSVMAQRNIVRPFEKNTENRIETPFGTTNKLAPDLQEKTDQLSDGFRADKIQK